MICNSCGRYIKDDVDVCPYCGYEFVIDQDRKLLSKGSTKKNRIVSPLRMIVSFVLHTLLLNIFCGVMSLAINLLWNKYSRKWGDSECYDARLDFTKLSLLRMLYYIVCWCSFFFNLGVILTKGAISLIYQIFPFLN